MQTLVPLRSRPELMDSSSLADPEMSGNVGNFLHSIGPPSRGEVIDGAIHQVTFYRASNDVQFRFG